jgi:hypothetical protein
VEQSEEELWVPLVLARQVAGDPFGVIEKRRIAQLGLL